MSKKPKHSRHRVPTLPVVSDPVDARYQAQVDMCTTRLEKRYRKAERALHTAQARAQRQEHLVAARTQDRKAARLLADLQKAVEVRRAELREIEVLMWPGGRDGRRRHVRLESGAITVPLGGTTGKIKAMAGEPMRPWNRR